MVYPTMARVAGLMLVKLLMSGFVETKEFTR